MIILPREARDNHTCGRDNSSKRRTLFEQAKGSPQVLRSAVYGGAIATGESDNNFYALMRKDSGDYEMIAACEKIGRELSELSSSFRSRAHLSPGYTQPVMRGLSLVVDPSKPSSKPTDGVTGRVWVEGVPASLAENGGGSGAQGYFCAHVVVMHGGAFPAFLQIALGTENARLLFLLPTFLGFVASLSWQTSTGKLSKSAVFCRRSATRGPKPRHRLPLRRQS
jgi:hypothetical protein